MPSPRRPYAQPESDLAVHPGELLAEELEARGLTQKDLAAIMERPAQAVNEIVRGKKAITADTALQLEAALGTPATFWLNLQSQYDLALARRAQARRAAATVTPDRRPMAVAETSTRYRAAAPNVARTPKAPHTRKP